MKKRHLIPLALLLLLALATPRGADAQVLYGSLTGNVADPSGAVVAGAKVEALNTGVQSRSEVAHAVNDGGPRIQYYPEARRNRGLAGYDRTHNFQLYGLWELPFGRGKRFADEGILSKLLGGFQLSGVMGAVSGSPFTIAQNNVFNLNAGGSGQAPDQVKSNVQIFSDNLKGTPPAGTDPARYQYFDRTAFAPVNIPAGQPQRFGNAGRNTLRGPGFFNMDLSLFRTIRFIEGIEMQLRAEALNALNHPNFANPASNVTDPNTFGYITSTAGQGSRIFRLGARVSF
jgi:hypothetical protein